MVVHYAFNENSGSTASDSSGNSLSGTVYGDATWTTGKSGNALYFDGTNDYVRIPSSGQSAPSQISSLSTGTISLWFKFEGTATGPGFLLPILYVGSSPETTGTKDGAIIEIGHMNIHSDSQELFYTVTEVGGEEPTFCFDSNENLTEGTWYHFVATVVRAATPAT